jgi:hypothetical protein
VSTLEELRMAFAKALNDETDAANKRRAAEAGT